MLKIVQVLVPEGGVEVMIFETFQKICMFTYVVREEARFGFVWDPRDIVIKIDYFSEEMFHIFQFNNALELRNLY